MISYVMVTQITKYETCQRVITYVMVIVTQSGDIEKIVEGSRTDDVIQHSNNMLTL